MEEIKIKSLKSSLFFGVISFLLMFLTWSLNVLLTSSGGPGNPVLVFLNDLHRIIFLSLAVFVPLGISIFFGKKWLYSEYPQKIFYKMPLYTIIPSIFMVFVGSFFIFGWMVIFASYYVIGYLILMPLLSLILALYFYITINKTIVSKVIITLSIIIILIESIFFIILISKVNVFDSCTGLGGGEYIDCMGQKAISQNNYEICYQISGDVEHRCLAQYAIAKNDSSYCEKVVAKAASKTMCYSEFYFETGQCEKIPNQNSQSAKECFAKRAEGVKS